MAVFNRFEINLSEGEKLGAEGAYLFNVLSDQRVEEIAKVSAEANSLKKSTLLLKTKSLGDSAKNQIEKSQI